jgi:exo-1,4-beta-D-glucosaminidase
MSSNRFRIFFFTGVLLSVNAGHAAQFGHFNPLTLTHSTIALDDGWRIQSSQTVSATGDLISQPGFADSAWYPARVPSTILGNLVDDSIALPGQDPFFGMNMNDVMGTPAFHPVDGDGVFAPEIPASSPFAQSWWYRREFTLPESSAGSNVDFTLNGITFGGEVWVNGTRVAGQNETLGSYREFHWEIAPFLKPAGSPNVIAVQVWPPASHDLSPTWVDWNVTPQDKNMGLWRGASLSLHGPIEILHPQVVSILSHSGENTALLQVEAIFNNSSDQTITGQAVGDIEDIHFSKNISLAPYESQTVLFSASDFPQLIIAQPRLWWPAQMGTPELYHLKIAFQGTEETTENEIDFGIRQVTSEFNDQGARQFSINGKPLLIRGGGWAPDLFMRYSPARIENEMNYVLDMGLNTIRLEGTMQPDSFYSLADRKGILIMPGLPCCNAWQIDATKWDADQKEIARTSVRDMLFSLRAHPSVFTFLYGSDEAPKPSIEKMYLAEVAATHFPNPVVASAATDNDEDGNPITGFKMNGPYDYVPPTYWLTDKTGGGAFGFNTETSPGPSIPPMQSLKKFLPDGDLDHIDSVWDFHAGENEFDNIRVHTKALQATYGPIQNMADMVEKSQLMDYDSHRAMFEAFNRNKNQGATGIVQWMLNNALPSVIWHLYDYYLQPNAAYYGTKEANRPLHLIYGYDNRQISLVNSTYVASTGLQVKAQVFDLDSHLISSQEVTASTQPNDTQILFPIQKPDSVRGGIYFLRLDLDDAQGTLLDRNFYWLSTKDPKFPLDVGSVDADFSALSSLPQTELKISSSWNSQNAAETVDITNTGQSIALFINFRLTHGTDQTDLLPVLWNENDITLVPGEHRVLKATLPSSQADMTSTEVPEIHGMGWNVTAW